MRLLKGIAVKRRIIERQEYVYGTLKLEAVSSYEGQSNAHKVQQEVCIGEVTAVSPDTEGVDVGDTVVLVYASSETPLPDGSEWYLASNVLARIKEGKLEGVGSYVLGFPLDNDQAIRAGLLAAPTLAAPDSWLQARYQDKKKREWFCSDGVLHIVPKGFVGQQVVDWEVYGLSDLPRTIYFVDKDSIAASTDILEAFGFPFPVPTLSQKHTTNYINLELKSNMPNLPSA